jgi:hypothetical protein
MATESAAPVTICPECGASIPKAGMSLCPYCASPLVSTPGKDQDRNPILKKLAKIEAKPEFEASKNITPPWTPQYQSARNQQSQGNILIIAGLVITGLEFLIGSGHAFGALFIGGVIISIFGLLQSIRGRSTRGSLDALPVQKRIAFVVTRRSETALGGEVVYFFLLTFGDGSEGEFSYPGRGSTHDLYSNGMTGLAFTRGQELLFIERLRA